MKKKAKGVKRFYVPPIPKAARTTVTKKKFWEPPDDFMPTPAQIARTRRCPLPQGCEIEHRRLYSAAPLDPCYNCPFWELVEHQHETPF